jgi:hypothetical protein
MLTQLYLAKYKQKDTKERLQGLYQAALVDRSGIQDEACLPLDLTYVAML